MLQEALPSVSNLEKIQADSLSKAQSNKTQITVNFAALEQAQNMLRTLSKRISAITNDPIFNTVANFWSEGPAKDALSDAFQKIKSYSINFNLLVCSVIASLDKAALAFAAADAKAVNVVGGSRASDKAP
jgi:uncharacterized protein YukE